MSQLSNQKIASIKTISNPVHHQSGHQASIQQQKPLVLSIVKPSLTATVQQQSPKPVIVAKRLNQALSPNFTTPACSSQVSPPVVSVNKLPHSNKFALSMTNTPGSHKVTHLNMKKAFSINLF
jgi:hypothetical protein